MNSEPPENAPVELSWTARKQIVLGRQSAVMTEFRDAARALRSAQAHLAPAIWRPHWIVAAGRSTAKVLTVRSFWIGYFALAALPSLACVVYFAAIASPQYVSEAKFAVHSGEKASLDALSSLIGAGSIQQVQNSMIVTDYIKSRAIVEGLEPRIGLRAKFARPEIDWISRFDSQGGMESLASYWRWKVKTSIEMPSGIVSVEVAAFTPEDSLQIAQAVVGVSEELVNGMTRRSRNDQLEQSRLELETAQKQMGDVDEALRRLRNNAGLIDPHRQAEGIGKMIERLQLERIEMDQQLNAELAGLDANAPQLKQLRLRAQALDVEIDKLQRMLTDPNPDKRATIANAMAEFDRLELDRKSAVTQYLAATATYERARADAAAQKVYLDTFVSPVLPQESLYPFRLWFAVLGIAASHMFWALALGGHAFLRRAAAQ